MSTWDRDLLCSPASNTGPAANCSPALVDNFQAHGTLDYIDPDVNDWINSLVVDSPQPLSICNTKPGVFPTERNQTSDRFSPERTTFTFIPASATKMHTGTNCKMTEVRKADGSGGSHHFTDKPAEKGQGDVPWSGFSAQGPQWLQYAKQLCMDQKVMPQTMPNAKQSMQGLTIHVHYHGVSVGDQTVNLPAATHGTPNAESKENVCQQHYRSTAKVGQADTCTPFGTRAQQGGYAVRTDSKIPLARYSEMDLMRGNRNAVCFESSVPTCTTSKRRKLTGHRKPIIPPLPIGPPKPLCIPPLPISSKPRQKGTNSIMPATKKPLSGRAKALHEARLERERREACMAVHPIANLAAENCEIISICGGDTPMDSSKKENPKKRVPKSSEGCQAMEERMAGPKDGDLRSLAGPHGQPDNVRATGFQQPASLKAPYPSARTKRVSRDVISTYSGKNTCARGGGRGRGRGRGRYAGAMKGPGRGLWKKRAMTHMNANLQDLATLSQRPANSAGSCADEEQLTESTVSEESCHPLMSMKSNAPVTSQHTDAPKADSQALKADMRSGGIVTCAPPAVSMATPDLEQNSLSEASSGSASPTKEDSDAQANPSAVADYIPENGTVTQSCLLILLEELVKGTNVVLMSDLREKLKEYSGLDKFYLEPLKDGSFWFKSFRWIQGRKFIRCPMRGPMTAELTDKGKDIATLSYERASAAGYINKIPEIDAYLKNADSPARQQWQEVISSEVGA
eukprot:jgi/Botrbrau1/19945/Bobra.0059s0062.1